MIMLHGLLFLALAASPASAESVVTHASALDSLVALHAVAMYWSSGNASGPAMDTLLAVAKTTQFVALGEEHNAREIPEFTTSLFERLQSQDGFQYLALEQDPVAARIVSRRPVRGRRDSVAALSWRYPHMFTFMADQELRMLADVSGRSQGKADPIWGCDQSFGVTHVLDQLLPELRAESARRFVATFRDTASTHERVRDLAADTFMSDSIAMLGHLREAVQPKPSSDADFLVASLESSNRIYRHFFAGRSYQNGSEREAYMKSRFMDEYRRAEAADHVAPKVLLKFGHWHLFRGLGPSGLQTLGNFASEFARVNGSDALTVALFPLGAPGEYGDLAKWSDPIPSRLARGLDRSRWTLVDFRALRRRYARLARELPPDQQESFRRWIYGFDFGLFMGGLQRGTYELNPRVAY